MLEIRNLHATVEGREILNGIDLIIRPGETHAIMGPNGSGKSTLANVIAGREGYVVTAGEIRFEGKTCWKWTRKPAPARVVSRISIPGRNSRRRQSLLSQGRRECGA